jgi:hypothetical protein
MGKIIEKKNHKWLQKGLKRLEIILCVAKKVEQNFAGIKF